MSTATQTASISQEIDRAARKLLEAAPQGSEVILFGSHARGDAGYYSDVDFLIVEPHVSDAWRESVRLRRQVAEFPLAMDVIVVSRARFEAERSHRNGLVAEASRGKIYRHETR